MCLYALFRKMFPDEEHRDFWKKLWTMQKKLPIIQAHSFVTVYVSSFMMEVTPLKKKAKTMDPKVRV